MRSCFFIGISVLSLLILSPSYAQEEPSKTIEEEESAEVFLEEYTDDFQEKFFEALKQKGIQNYDRAINLLLECKRLDANSVVIDHELAKAYYLDKKYISAQQYAIEALIAAPKNYWYLDTLISILDKQSNSIEAVKSNIPFNENKLKENLALIYYKKRKYQEALKILNGISNSDFKDELTLKINDSLNKPLEQPTVKSATFTVENNESTTEGMEMNIKNQIRLEQYRIVEKTAKDAVEAYPLQPYFYYAYGLALHKNNKNSQAIEILESSLDYLFDDISLANKIYQTLADAYTKINNFSKANLYLSKIKPGF
ncbi:tetratricopeptide repeat protein [uncultured Croceitalea sp.]|uniref:tetratricopeptide repeat protein n=1 Tax=uncultured Croceitalea sp. TaxID=1798908 RepID=UPI00374F1E12